MRPVFQSESAMAQTVLLLLLFLWDTLPLTTEVNTCKVSRNDGTSYNPGNKILFTPGETVTVSCGEKMWVKNILEQSAELTCQDNGEWDFHYVCQSVRCFKATDKLSFFDTHSSQRDTYFMNETVLYLCDPEYLETSPTATATCTRQGWEPNPLCQRPSCSIPPLENFVVEEEKTDYKLNEVLRYRCNKNYKKAVLGLTTCMKVGRSAQWSPSPWCEPASCKVSANPVPGTSYSPRGQNIFKPGENVTVSCGEKMYIKNTELRSAELTCQDDGEWDSYHVCRIVTCDNYDETVQRWENNYTSRQVDESVSYQCRDGYKQTSPTATCTRRGWTPNPLCQVITCKLSADRTDGTSYCPRNKILFTPGETVTVSCGEKMWVKNMLEQSAELTCQDDGEWDFHHVCQNVTCFKATDKIGSFGAHFYRPEAYLEGETAWYSCIRGYEETSPTATCTRRGWDPNPLCSVNICKVSPHRGGGTSYYPRNKIHFKPGEMVTVSCDEKMWVKNVLQSSARLTCQDNGNWDFYHVCQSVTCYKPYNLMQSFGTSFHPRSSYSMNEAVPYSCIRGYEETSPRAICTRRGWDPNPLCSDGRCGKPSVIYAEIKDGLVLDKYPPGSRVGLRCTYDTSVSFYVSCRFGKWTGDIPNCKKKPCTSDPVIPNGVIQSNTKTVYEHNEELQIRCNHRGTFKVTCRFGEWYKPDYCEG